MATVQESYLVQLPEKRTDNTYVSAQNIFAEFRTQFLATFPSGYMVTMSEKAQQYELSANLSRSYQVRFATGTGATGSTDDGAVTTMCNTIKTNLTLADVWWQRTAVTDETV